MEETNNEVKPKRYLFRLCLSLTIIYPFIIFFILFMNLYYSPPSPRLGLNEIGDFLAGAFSPLAFAWLVYGYLMQSKELRDNNTATNETQSLARDHLDFQKLQENKIQEEKLRLAQPDLEVVKVDYKCPYDANSDAYSIQVKNHGASISSFRLFDEQRNYLSSPHSIPHGEEAKIEIYGKSELPTTEKAGVHDLETYNITYFDSLKIMQEATMKLILEKIDGNKAEQEESQCKNEVYSAYITPDKKLNKE